MNSIIFAMSAFAIVGAATPGPVNLLATTTAIQKGHHEATKLVIGASVAYAVVVLICGSLMQQIVAWLPAVSVFMRWLGSGFLLYMAYQIFTAPVSQLTQASGSLSGWWVGALTQLLNPKAWLVAMSGVSLYVFGQSDPLQWLWIFTFVSLVCCLIGVGLWAIAGRWLAGFLHQHRRQIIFNRIMATVLAVSVSMIWST
ncbi:LysE family translocator [Vibrio sp. JPW-9-11-11]|uniref:LysE family translocator n=1 Tax=Vibrio sp. JPW-9-11-11 TaxID=1416532 RepID=UPI00159342C7|nr:LysE family translocator [Vibrio sp. JPW-9-11-11]NVD08570.1 LysE family translocator [Vibrio sp. JPW-9-11-11]